MKREYNLKELALEYWNLKQDFLKEKGIDSFEVFYRATVFQFQQLSDSMENYDFSTISMKGFGKFGTTLGMLNKLRKVVDNSQYLTDEQKLERIVIIDDKIDELLKLKKRRKNGDRYRQPNT